MAPPIPDRVRARWAAIGGKAGLGLAAAGFLVILLAWNGAAGLDYTQGQVPYIISGGFGGLGLVVLGAALVITESHRRDRAELERRLDDVIAALSRMATLSRVTGNGSEGAGAEEAGAEPVKVPATAGAPALVVAGRSSYHSPDCHLAAGRESDLLPRAAAEDAGLDPCRVCNP